MLRALLLIAVATGSLLAETPQELFDRASQKIISDIGRMPNYTCVQTMTRSYYEDSNPGIALARCQDMVDSVADRQKTTLQLSWVDRLHFDVAVSEGKEIFSWAGDKHFQSDRNAELADEGIIGTGDFAGFVSSIFGRGDATFRYLGQHQEKGAVVAEFHYRVPLAKSSYVLRSGAVSAKAGFQGTLWLDPVTADLKRMTVSTEDTPSETKMCQANTAMDYERVSMGKGSFLLPKATELIVLGTDGSKADNKTEYAGCRQYSGESTIHFEDVADDRPAARVSKTLEIPAGLELAVRLRTPLDSNTMMAGDAVTGVLVKPLKDQSGQVLLPRDAVVHGRLLRMQKRLKPEHLFLVGLRFDSVEFADTSAALWLEPVIDKNGGGLNKPGKQEMKATSFKDDARKGDRIGTGMFVFPGDQLAVPAGAVSRWRTRPSRSIQ